MWSQRNRLEEHLGSHEGMETSLRDDLDLPSEKPTQLSLEAERVQEIGTLAECDREVRVVRPGGGRCHAPTSYVYAYVPMHAGACGGRRALTRLRAPALTGPIRARSARGGGDRPFDSTRSIIGPRHRHKGQTDVVAARRLALEPLLRPGATMERWPPTAQPYSLSNNRIYVILVPSECLARPRPEVSALTPEGGGVLGRSILGGVAGGLGRLGQ